MSTPNTLTDVYNQILKIVGNRGNVPEMVHIAMRDFLSLITDDKEALDSLLASGLNHDFRGRLKRSAGGDDGTPSTQAQLSLWSAGLRSYVQEINRARVFVPSRNCFVTLLPGALTKAEVIEAGEHLINHGAACVRRGRQLLRLAEHLEASVTVE